MAHSTRRSDCRKQTKPYDKFPLTPRDDGRWCKRIRGKLELFTGDWKEALDEYDRCKAALYAGRPRPPKGSPDAIDLAELVNQFLHHKKQRVDSGERSPRTWQSYEAVGKTLVEFFGRNYPPEHLQPADFQRLRAHLAKTYGPVSLGNRIQVVRMIFKYGVTKGLLAKPAAYGDEFDKPDKATLRRVKNAKGNQALTTTQIQSLLKAAEPHMRAMIYLGINGGLGNADLALLTPEAFDLDGGWLNYPRAKTAVPRRIPLWPETVEAVRDAIANRRTAKDPDDARLLFIGARGQSYVNDTGGHRIAHEFTRLRDRLKIPAHTFYDLRRTFATVADNLSHDRDGVKAIMGHAPASEDMLNAYVQGFWDDRLRNIVNHVRGWLYAPPAKDLRVGGLKVFAG